MHQVTLVLIPRLLINIYVIKIPKLTFDHLVHITPFIQWETVQNYERHNIREF